MTVCKTKRGELPAIRWREVIVAVEAHFTDDSCHWNDVMRPHSIILVACYFDTQNGLSILYVQFKTEGFLFRSASCCWRRSRCDTEQNLARIHEENKFDESVGTPVDTHIQSESNEVNHHNNNSSFATPPAKNSHPGPLEESSVSHKTVEMPRPRKPAKHAATTTASTPTASMPNKKKKAVVTPTPAATCKRTTEANATPKKQHQSASKKAKSKEIAKSNASRQPPVKPGSRIKCRRSQIFHCLSPNLQKYLPREDPNYQNYFGSVVRKNKKRKDPTHDIRLDIFADNEIATNLRGDCFRTFNPDNDEIPVDPKYLKNNEEEAVLVDEEIKDAVETVCEKDFVSQDRQTLLTAKTFTHKYNQKKEPVNWTILSADEHVTNCDKFKDILDDVEDGPKISSALDFNLSHGEFFLKHMWPDMTGFGRRIDKYHASVESKYFNTVKDRKIKINCPDMEDPDFKVKQAVLLVVKSTVVPGTGVDQFFRCGTLPGSNENIYYPDFGKFMDINEFKVIVHAYMWGDKNLWYRDQRDVPWDIFMPFIDAWNEKQRGLFVHFRQVLVDESMVGRVPKESKLGGLPNYTYESRKPVPLGTMLKDASELATGILVHTDPLMTPLIQSVKMFATQPLFAPDVDHKFEPQPAHTAEMLRQAYMAGLSSGCWLGGDAWFGSVETCLALKLQEVTHIRTGVEE